MLRSEKLTFSPLMYKGHQIKPIAVHHSLILGLGKPPQWPVKTEDLQELWASMKMSKSKPHTAIFINDSPEEIRKKISKAFCPEKEIDFNPLIDWSGKIVFPVLGKLEIKRNSKFGGDITITSFEKLKSEFKSGRWAPLKIGEGRIVPSTAV